MDKVKKVIRILTNVKAEFQDKYNVEVFKQKEKDFKKEHAVAKDFVKFLLTLERQFKNINKGELKAIEDTLQSLLNGLKLIWTISKHISHPDQNENFQNIIEAISNEICQKVRNKINIRTIFKPKSGNIMESIEDIDKAIAVLENWVLAFNQMRLNIEGEATIARWEFPKAKEIFQQPKHIKEICGDIRKICVAIKDFNAILNKDLKAVTGSGDEIDQVAERVKEYVDKIQKIQNDVFKEENKAEWGASFKTFEGQIAEVETQTINMINQTFEDKLTSSLGAFELLDNFKHIETR